MIGRLVRSIDFERVLRTRSRASSPHFALHHLPGVPTRYVAARADTDVSHGLPTELCTDVAPKQIVPVDDLDIDKTSLPGLRPSSAWLGTVVPKRHARRAVTRTLLKRQIKSVASGGSSPLAAGLWVVRLRSPFDRVIFPSAASDALRQHARAELEHLFARAFERRVAC